MKKYKLLITVSLGTILILAGTGCSLSAKHTNTDTGMEAIQELDYDGALACFEAAETAGEDMRLLYRGKGLSLMGKTDYEAALEAFKTALSHSNGMPDEIDYDINYYMAVAYYKTGQKDQAVAAYDAILSLRENDRNAYYLRGAIRIEQGHLEEARADFDKALALDSKDNDRLIDIYCVLEANGYKEVGQEYLKAAMEKDTKSMTNFEKGRISYYLNDYEAAKTYLEKARDSSYQAVLFLGRTYEMLGDYNYAVSVYNAYLDAGNPNAQIYNQLGICKLNMREYDAALSAFQAGMNVEENEILQTMRFNEIVTYEYLQQYKKAAVLMDGYLKTYPDDERAAREYVFLESR